MTQNNSTSPGTDLWGQGSDNVFESQAGVPDAFLGVGIGSTAGETGETLSNWILTPTLPLDGSPTLSLWTRTVSVPAFADRLEVWCSNTGAGTNVGIGAADVGDFTGVLLTINPALSLSGYPAGWTQYETVLPALAPGTTGRIAFRYFVTNSGLLSDNGDYIGVDTVRVRETVAAPLRKRLRRGSLHVTVKKSLAD